MGSSCKVLFYFNLQLQGLGLFFFLQQSMNEYFSFKQFILAMIYICPLLGDLCSRTSHSVFELKPVWTCSVMEARQSPFSQLLWYCHSQNKQSLCFCSRTFSLWYFAPILFLKRCFSHCVFPIQCRFNYLNLSIEEKKIYLMMGYFFFRVSQASMEEEVLKGDR